MRIQIAWILQGALILWAEMRQTTRSEWAFFVTSVWQRESQGNKRKYISLKRWWWSWWYQHYSSRMNNNVNNNSRHNYRKIWITTWWITKQTDFTFGNITIFRTQSSKLTARWRFHKALFPFELQRQKKKFFFL